MEAFILEVLSTIEASNRAGFFFLWCNMVGSGGLQYSGVSPWCSPNFPKIGKTSVASVHRLINHTSHICGCASVRPVSRVFNVIRSFDAVVSVDHFATFR